MPNWVLPRGAGVPRMSLSEDRQVRNLKWNADRRPRWCGENGCGTSVERNCVKDQSDLKKCSSMSKYEDDYFTGQVVCTDVRWRWENKGAMRCKRTDPDNDVWNEMRDASFEEKYRCCTADPSLTIDERTKCGNLWNGLPKGAPSDPDCVAAMADQCKSVKRSDKRCRDFHRDFPNQPRPTTEELIRYCKNKIPNEDNDEVCGCHYPAELYDAIKQEWKKTYEKDPPSRGGRHCWYEGCKRSGYRNLREDQSECPRTLVAQCLPSINVNCDGCTFKNSVLEVVNKADCSVEAGTEPASTKPVGTVSAEDRETEAMCNEKIHIETDRCHAFFTKYNRSPPESTLRSMCQNRKPSPENDPVCGCYYDDKFYDAIGEKFANLKGLPRKCIYEGCRVSKFKPSSDGCPEFVTNDCRPRVNLSCKDCTTDDPGYFQISSGCVTPAATKPPQAKPPQTTKPETYVYVIIGSVSGVVLLFAILMTLSRTTRLRPF